MYELHGTEEGLRRLAKRYPGGSIKKELQNRMAEADEVDGSDESMGNLIEELAENC
jgi:intracellular multiplication protein IcmB